MIGEEPDWTEEQAQMVLTLHNLAKTYKMLPSEALDRATTFDLYVLDTFHRYSKYQEAQQSGQKQPHSVMGKPRPKLSQAEMQSMIDRVRAKSKERRSGRS